MRLRPCALVAPCLAVLSAATAFCAVPITPADLGPDVTKITFETDPLGNPVALGTLAGSIWSSLGVQFDSNDLVGDPPAGDFTITSPPNVLSGDNVSAFGPIHATFDPPVFLVGAWGFDFVLEVFDAEGNSLGMGTYTDGSPGLFGGAAEFAFLGFQSDVPIALAQFRRAFPGSAFGYHIDDLVFKQVPEPSTLVLCGSLIAFLALRRLAVSFI